jgi:hypothetical protein
MKLLKTIEKLVEESQKIYEEACEKGENPKKLDLLEKRYLDSLKLMKLYRTIKK